MAEAIKAVAMAFLDHHDPEWERLWTYVGERYGDQRCQCPITFEVWQYMGSAKIQAEDGRELWVHQLRHRALPPAGTSPFDTKLEQPGPRTLVNVEADALWAPAMERAV